MLRRSYAEKVRTAGGPREGGTRVSVIDVTTVMSRFLLVEPGTREVWIEPDAGPGSKSINGQS